MLVIPDVCSTLPSYRVAGRILGTRLSSGVAPL